VRNDLARWVDIGTQKLLSPYLVSLMKSLVNVIVKRWGLDIQLHCRLTLRNSFNKTEAAIFPCRLCFPRAPLVLSLIYFNTGKRRDNNKN